MPPSLISSTRTSTENVIPLLRKQEDLVFFQYPKLLLRQELSHAIFTRLGGVSSPPFDTLNTSYSAGDRPEHVKANLLRIQEGMGADHLVFMNQCHGDKIVVFREGDFRKPLSIPSADAMICNVPGIALLVKQADCQSVILFDPVQRVAANVHCGWRGNVLNVLGRVVMRICQEFGTRASDLLGAIGPSLGPCCAEFITHREIFPQTFSRFMVAKNHFDLRALSVRQLVEAGLREENIELARICTRCRTNLFYSYRGEGKTGRFGTAVMLR